MSEERWRRRGDVLSRRSLDAVLLLPAGATGPVTLAGTGPEIWDLLATPRSVSELSRELAHRHRADPSTVERDLVPMIERLALLDAIEPEP